MKNYIENINNVLSYIDAHLAEEHTLEKLSKKAHLSKFHFHRIMKAYLNESLGSYINRIRMETAIKLIRYSNQPIKEIAYNVGYQTPAAFNKTFKKKFNTTPLSNSPYKICVRICLKPNKVVKFSYQTKTYDHVEYSRNTRSNIRKIYRFSQTGAQIFDRII